MSTLTDTVSAITRLRRSTANGEPAAVPKSAWPFSHATSVKIARAAIIAAAFFVLASAPLFISSHNAITVRVPSGIQKHAPETVGRSSFPLADGKTCRELVFDRMSGDIVESATGPCGRMPGRAGVLEERTAPPLGFSWGGRK